MRYLVTGGCGYIGSCLSARLLSDGHEVHIIDWMTGASKKNAFTLAKMGAKLFTADFDEATDLIYEHDYDAVFHFAAFIEVEESFTCSGDYYWNNTMKTSMLVDSCSECGVKHLIFASTAAVYEAKNDLLKETDVCNPSSPYGLSKLMSEQILELHQKDEEQMKVICFRYFNVAGADIEEFIGEDRPKETHIIPIAILNKIIGDKTRIFGDDYPTKDGTCIRDYISINDLIEAHLSALNYTKSNFEIFNIGSGKGHSVLEILQTLEAEYEITERRVGDPEFLVADISKAEKMLDWKPKENLKEILENAQMYQEFNHGC